MLDNYTNFAPMFKNEIYIMIGIKSKLSYGTSKIIKTSYSK